MGRSIFSTSGYTWHVLINRLMQDQDMLDSTYHWASGYGRDSYPFNTCDAPGSEQLFRHQRLLDGSKWSLRCNLPVSQLGTWNSENTTLIPSSLGFSIEFEFQSSDFCLIRPKNTKHQPLKLMLHDFKLIPNFKVLVEPIPRNRLTNISIPFHDESLFTFQAIKGALTVSSGQWSMPNHPTKCIIFFTKASAETQLQNPFEIVSFQAGMYFTL